jgi:formylglycine-generating enzyme required for sulfatase activity
LHEPAVTQTQYEAFLQANVSLAGQPSVCSGNTTYAPGSGCVTPYSPTSNLPVVCVNWCDAYAYCLWAGKRLCGKIGGGPNPYNSYADATSSQWYAACSNGGDGQHAYPYGPTYNAATCDGADKGLGATVVSGSLSCEGAFPGLYDMSGNVFEHEDSTSGTLMRARGGGFTSSAANLLCGAPNYNGPTNYNEYTGFRCCKD